MRRRIFSSLATHHIYQRCKDHGVLFYTTEDRLVYYTLAACKAKKYRIKVSAASLMYTHLHQAVIAESLASLRAYLRETDSSFSRLYNYHYSRTGRLFEKPPGRSQKVSSKDKRSIIAYVFNNHVEKGLCSRAVEERWSFLAFACSNHPFSIEIKSREVSNTLNKAIRLVDRRIKKLKALEYIDLEKVFNTLNAEEKEQFIDYVISQYAWIDFSEAISHYDSLESMILSIDSTTGGEFEIREDYTRQKDTGYSELIRMAERDGYLDRIFRMSSSEILGRIMSYSMEAAVHPEQMKRFFHYSFDVKRETK